MMRPNQRALAVVAVTTALSHFGLAHAAFAQRANAEQPDVVPRALAEAIATPPMQMLLAFVVTPDTTRLFSVGALPAPLTDVLWVPPGASIVGGIQAGPLSLGIIRSELPADALAAAYRREQSRRGWTVDTPNAGVTQGFAPAPSPDTASDVVFCSRGRTLVVQTISRANAREMRAYLLPQIQQCGAPNGNGRIAERQLRIPMLRNPAGTGDGSGRTCPQWNTGTSGINTKLDTAMPVAEVLSHYDRQLTDSGWKAATMEVASRRWVQTDSTGHVSELTITARRDRSAPGCIEVKMDANARQ